MYGRFLTRSWYEVPRVAGMNDHKLGGLRTTDLLCHTYRDYQPAVELSVGPHSLWGLLGSSSLPLPVSIISPNPWHPLASHCIISILASAFFPMCVPMFLSNLPRLIGTPVIGLRTHPAPGWPGLNFSTSAMTLLPNEVTFIGTGWGDVIRLSEGHNSTPNIPIQKFSM